MSPLSSSLSITATGRAWSITPGNCPSGKILPQWVQYTKKNKVFPLSLGKKIDIYTGTHGILQYRDVNNNKKNIFLYEDKYVPAPRFFWKVLREKDSNTAAVFIGLNDPHERVAPLELCPNRCAEMAWVDWEMTDLDGGYMYCCDLQEAATVFPEIGSLRLSSSGLLQGNDRPVTPPTSTQPLSSDLCRINLDQLTGKYPPIILQNDRFVFPTSEDPDGSRYLNFGLIS